MIAALILAGGKMSADLEAVAGGATNRALIKVGANDETMLDLVVQAVKGGLGNDGRILVAGDVPCPAHCEPVNGGESFVDSLMNGVAALNPDENRLLLATADAPFLTAESVADFVERADAFRDAPFVYPLIDAEKCGRAFPGMKRTALKIAEGTFTGGNIALLDPAFLRQNARAIRDAYALRKNIPGLAQSLGAEIILRLIASRVFPDLLGIAHVETALAKLLHCATPRAIVTPHVGIGADVDKPEDVAIARTILRNTPAIAHTI